MDLAESSVRVMSMDKLQRILREDILRALAESGGVLFSRDLRREALLNRTDEFDDKYEGIINELNGKGLIRIEKDRVHLTKSGLSEAKRILDKHVLLEEYYRGKLSLQEAHRKAHLLEHYVSEEVLRNVLKLKGLRGSGVKLLNLLPKDSGIIADILLKDVRSFERLVSMGILPGEVIRLELKAPDYFLVSLKDRRFAIDRFFADSILVVRSLEGRQ